MKPAMLSMNQSSVININSRAWNVLCWNVRGINDKEKWNSIRNKIEESGANIFFAFRRLREKLLISSMLGSLLLNVLTSLIIAHLWGHLGEYLFVGVVHIFQ